jgi:phosphate transport system permease protein/phosphate transport system substrate-binding protein
METKIGFKLMIAAVLVIVSTIPVSSSSNLVAQSPATLNGAGATFPFPLIDTWRVEYPAVDPGVNINYQSIGSGGGVKQFTEKTVDFGATDAPLTPEEETNAPGAVHIPETIGSVVAAYNLPGVPDKGLKLTGPVLADIYLGKITKWNDPRIVELNPELSLPDADIITVHRSDGSGTTFVWTDYLSAVSPEWSDQVGKGKSVQWPTGLGAPGNEGVANGIKGSENSIGYVELAYALTTGMPFAFVQNQAGNFVEPTLASTEAAVAASAGNLPAGDASWNNVTLVNAQGADSYPIASFSYLLLYKELADNPTMTEAKAKALTDFVNWAITDGQQFSPELEYVPLPDQVVKLNQDTLSQITFKGNSIANSTQG